MKNNLLKNLKNISLSKGHDPAKMDITPFRDWRIVVMAFFSSLVVAIGFNVYMSIEINQDSFFTAPAKSMELVEFNMGGLDAVLARLAEKETLFEKAVTEKTTIVDPSR